MSIDVSSNDISIDKTFRSSIKGVKGLAEERKEVNSNSSVSDLSVSLGSKSSNLRVEFSVNEGS